MFTAGSYDEYRRPDIAQIHRTFAGLGDRPYGSAAGQLAHRKFREVLQLAEHYLRSSNYTDVIVAALSIHALRNFIHS